MITIRDVTPDDAGTLADIYAYYVENTAITFECSAPSEEEFRDRIRDISAKYPYIVLEDDGMIMGYSYAHAFVGREAYSHSCEMTVYLSPAVRHKGYGRMLYEAMESRLKNMGIINLYACIGDPITEDEYLTRNSEMFHEHMGYHRCGLFTRCGYKFGRWYNIIWMEKIIGKYD
ncbi:phosphinothricin acetyltransferase [Ruminococcaceae bacterium YRB3002]|nr:phosphinothricin acetyltransferase [Ruminococcaceae bacterium YRB3002]